MKDRIERSKEKKEMEDRGEDMEGIEDGMNGEKDLGEEIELRNNRIMWKVKEKKGKVERVGSIKGGVWKKIEGEVGRVEVIVKGKELIEVRDDRGIDDLKRRIGNKEKNEEKMENMVERKKGKRMRNNVERVNMIMEKGKRIELEGIKERNNILGDIVGWIEKGVKEIVVILEMSNKEVIVMMLVLGSKRLGLRKDIGIRLRDENVIIEEGDKRKERMGKKKMNDEVKEDKSIFMEEMEVKMVDNIGDVIIGNIMIEDIERKVEVIRKKLKNDNEERSSVVNIRKRVELGIESIEKEIDIGVKSEEIVLKRML